MRAGMEPLRMTSVVWRSILRLSADSLALFRDMSAEMDWIGFLQIPHGAGSAECIIWIFNSSQGWRNIRRTFLHVDTSCHFVNSLGFNFVISLFRIWIGTDMPSSKLQDVPMSTESRWSIFVLGLSKSPALGAELRWSYKVQTQNVVLWMSFSSFKIYNKDF